MARLNTRPSSRYDAQSPTPDISSDQENRDPLPTRMDKGKGRAFDPTPSRSNLPTPNSDSSGGESRGQKRKRVGEQPRQERRQGREENADQEVDNERREGGGAGEASWFNRHYDPNQDPEERREIKRKSRALEREFHENRDELLRESGTGLTTTLQKAERIYRGVKQTNDATLDSRLLVNVSDLAYKKTNQLVLGDSSNGVDVDEFLLKCISYMRNGGPVARERDEDAPPRQQARRAQNDEESDAEDDDDMPEGALDWELLGRHACFPFNARPCVPSFLLGPLSVEKKHRTHTQRRARQSKDTISREAQPEALTREDLSRSDDKGLTAICERINKHLNQHVARAEKALGQAGFRSPDELHTQQGRDMLRKYRLRDTGGPSLFDYVVNPHSFGQTVENLFYVSFLIKEGTFGIETDSQGLPTIVPSKPRTLEEQRRDKTSKHQAVFSLDYATWEKLIDAYDIREPLIEHRQEDEEHAEAVGQRGWYN